MEISRFMMKILKRLLKRIQRIERENLVVQPPEPHESPWGIARHKRARQMYQRGMGFWALGVMWKRMKPHKVAGEFLQVGGANLMNKATLKALDSRENNWNPMETLESLSIVFHGDTMRIRSKDDAKIARNFKVRCGWTGSIDVERPMTEEMAEILAVFEL